MTIEQLLKLLAKVLNTSEAKIKEYLEGDEGEDAVIQIGADALKKRFDEGHKKALGKGVKELVEALKAEFDFDVTGTTPDEITASIKAGFETIKGSDISEETIKASDTYKELQTQLARKDQETNKLVEKRAKELVKDKEVEWKAEIKKAKRQVVETDLYVLAENWLKKKNAILHEDADKRRKQIQLLAKQLESHDLEKDSDGKYLISKDGSPILNKSGHNATLDDVFEEHDHLYVYQDVKQRRSSGLDPNGKTGGSGSDFKHFKGEVPKSKEEMDKIYLDFSYGKIEKDAFQEVKTAYEATTDK